LRRLNGRFGKNKDGAAVAKERIHHREITLDAQQEELS